MCVDYLVDAKPSAATTSMIDMFAWKGDAPVATFILHLANNTPVYKKRKSTE